MLFLEYLITPLDRRNQKLKTDDLLNHFHYFQRFPNGMMKKPGKFLFDETKEFIAYEYPGNQSAKNNKLHTIMTASISKYPFWEGFGRIEITNATCLDPNSRRSFIRVLDISGCANRWEEYTNRMSWIQEAYRESKDPNKVFDQEMYDYWGNSASREISNLQNDIEKIILEYEAKGI